MKKLLRWNGVFAYDYILDGKRVYLIDLIREHAEKMGIEIVEGGNGTEDYDIYKNPFFNK
jgi:hypothetical protein